MGVFSNDLTLHVFPWGHCCTREYSGVLEERGCGHDMGVTVRESKQLVATRLLLMANAPLDFLPLYPAPLAISWAAIYRTHRWSVRGSVAHSTLTRRVVKIWTSFLRPAVLVYWGNGNLGKRTEITGTRSKGWSTCEAANPSKSVVLMDVHMTKKGEQGTEHPWQRMQSKPTEAYNIVF